MSFVLQLLGLLLYVSILCHAAQYDCDKDADTGPCRAYFIRWFHNPETDECETFVYGGCLGNKNRFLTKEECEEKCKCYFEKDSGPCYAKFKRYYYNPKKNKCKKFIYGGCEGNPNNFKTKKKCKKECKNR